MCGRFFFLFSTSYLLLDLYVLFRRIFLILLFDIFYQSEDDMQSNFSHLSEAEFTSRLSELAEYSDEEEEDEEEKKENSSNKLADRSKQ